MSRRPDFPLYGKKYCGDRAKKEVHDLDHEDTGPEGCHVDRIIDAGQARGFVPDTLEQAGNEGFKNCPKCLGLHRATFVRAMIVLVMATALVAAALEAQSFISELNNCVEVGGGKIATVPLDAKYVKYNGQVRRVVKFASTLSDGQGDCKCPKCCDGGCYVIIYVGAAQAAAAPAGLPGAGASSLRSTSDPLVHILYILWVVC